MKKDDQAGHIQSSTCIVRTRQNFNWLPCGFDQFVLALNQCLTILVYLIKIANDSVWTCVHDT